MVMVLEPSEYIVPEAERHAALGLYSKATSAYAEGKDVALFRYRATEVKFLQALADGLKPDGVETLYQQAKEVVRTRRVDTGQINVLVAKDKGKTSIYSILGNDIEKYQQGMAALLATYDTGQTAKFKDEKIAPEDRLRISLITLGHIPIPSEAIINKLIDTAGTDSRILKEIRAQLKGEIHQSVTPLPPSGTSMGVSDSVRTTV